MPRREHSMKVWVVLWEDRHTDPDVRLFTTQDQAIQFARETAREYGSRHPEDIREHSYGILGTPKWYFIVQYSGESGQLSVMARDITEE
jgi:hypothetical protein